MEEILEMILLCSVVKHTYLRHKNTGMSNLKQWPEQSEFWCVVGNVKRTDEKSNKLESVKLNMSN
jgi:hypothetical protein